MTHSLAQLVLTSPELKRMLAETYPAYNALHGITVTFDTKRQLVLKGLDPRQQSHRLVIGTTGFSQFVRNHSTTKGKGAIGESTQANRDGLERAKAAIKKELLLIHHDFTYSFIQAMQEFSKHMPKSPSAELTEAQQIAIRLYNKWAQDVLPHTQENKDLCLLALHHFHRFLFPHITDPRTTQNLLQACQNNPVLTDRQKQKHVKNIQRELSGMFFAATKLLAAEKLIDYGRDIPEVRSEPQIRDTNKNLHALFAELSRVAS